MNVYVGKGKCPDCKILSGYEHETWCVRRTAAMKKPTSAQLRYRLRKLLYERADKQRQGFTEAQLKSYSERIARTQSQLEERIAADSVNTAG